MSKVFYDHLIVLEDLEEVIKTKAKTTEEREELWALVDELIHHRVVGCILDRLPPEHHHEFLDKFAKAPHDDGILGFLKERVEDIEEAIVGVVKKLGEEIKEELRAQ